jgi:hypothetical protein
MHGTCSINSAGVTPSCTRQRAECAPPRLLAGLALLAPGMALVVVEGCKKAVGRYNKLMLRRIQWGAQDVLAEDDAGADHEPNSCMLVRPLQPFRCAALRLLKFMYPTALLLSLLLLLLPLLLLLLLPLPLPLPLLLLLLNVLLPPLLLPQVWQGQVQGKSFQHFTTKHCSSDSEGKAALQKAGVAHYWDVAVNCKQEDAPIVPI